MAETEQAYDNVEVEFEGGDGEQQLEQEVVEQTDEADSQEEEGFAEATLKEQLAFYKQSLRQSRIAQSKITKDGYKATRLPAEDTPSYVNCYKMRLQKHLKAAQRGVKGRQEGNVDFCPNRNTMFKRCQLNIQNLKMKIQEARVRPATL